MAKIDDLLKEFDGCIPQDACTPMLIDDINSEIKKTFIDQDISERFKTEIVDEQRAKLLEFMRNDDTIIIVAFSGGKDSIAMVLDLLYNYKFPKEQIRLYHHDVDGHGEPLFDWACTPDYCRAFAEAFDLPIYFSHRKGGIVKGIYRVNEPLPDTLYQSEPNGKYHVIKSDPTKINTRLKFPAVGADLQTRWCSGHVKIDVMRKIFTNDPQFKNANVVLCTGERRAESTARSKYKEIELGGNTTKTRTIYNWRMIIDWSDAQVWDIMKEHKVQPHPAYELGWSRCSCQTCIFNSANIWNNVNELSPEKIERIAEIEKDINHSLYQESKTIPAKDYYKEGFDKSDLMVDTSVEYNSPTFGKVKKGKILEVERINNVTNYLVKMANSQREKLDTPESITENDIVDVVKVKYFAVKNIHDKLKQGKSTLNKELIDKWGDQATKEWTAPIIVDDWKMPAGAYSNENAGAS